MPKKIVFLSPMCLLDTRSGAALEMRIVLAWLAEAGWEAYALTASLFDGREEFPLGSVIGPQNARKENQGRVISLYQEGIRHYIYYTASSSGVNLKQSEARGILDLVKHKLGQIKPDIVIGYGSSSLSRKLWDIARGYARQMIFYLANANYRDADLFAPFDRVWCPSRFLCEYYRKTLGIEPEVLATCFDNRIVPCFADPGEVVPVLHPDVRRSCFVTFINPAPYKGATLFFQLVNMVQKERPDWTFLCVEGRFGFTEWTKRGIDLPGAPNVWCLPNQQDMRRVYRQTSVLLFPSYWNEAAGRAPVEAQLGGIPVLASNRGGIPDQLGDGGFLFDPPQGSAENYLTVPGEEEVRPWLDTLARLMDEEAFYLQAVERAHKAAESFRPENRKPEAIRQVESLIQG